MHPWLPWLRLRAETTVGVKWIAQRLPMGSWTHCGTAESHDEMWKCDNTWNRFNVSKVSLYDNIIN
jgi:hypothetical protein